MTKNRRVGGFFLPASFAAEERRIQPMVKVIFSAGDCLRCPLDPPIRSAGDEEGKMAGDEGKGGVGRACAGR